MSFSVFGQLLDYVNEMPARSAWNRAVKLYALDLLDSVEMEAIENAPQFGAGWAVTQYRGQVNGLRHVLINGARTWLEYSEGGCSLIYDDEIAERCCSPAVYAKSNHGEKMTLRGRSWLEVQAWGLNQAARHLCYCHATIMKARALEAGDNVDAWQDPREVTGA